MSPELLWLPLLCSCQKLVGGRLEPSRIKARGGKPPGAGETDASEYEGECGQNVTD